MLKVMFSLSKNRAVGLEFSLHNHVTIQMRPGETKAITFEDNEESDRANVLDWYRQRYTRMGLTVDTPNNEAKREASRNNTAAKEAAAKKAEEEKKAAEEAAKKAEEEKKAAEEAAKKAEEEKKAAEEAAKKAEESAEESKASEPKETKKGSKKGNDTVEI